MALSSLKHSRPQAGCVSNIADGENVYKYINFVAQIYAKHIFAQILYRILDLVLTLKKVKFGKSTKEQQKYL